jgi:subfamily B ATP-binding cassette protein MsbA
MIPLTIVQSPQLYVRLLKEFLPYKWVAVATLVGVGVASLTDVLLIRQLQNVVDAVSPEALGGALQPSGMLAVVRGWLDGILPSDPKAAVLWSIPTLIMALALLRMVSTFCGDYGSSWLTQRVQANVREKMFGRVLRLPNRYFDQSSTGTTLSRIAFDATQVTQAGLSVFTIAVRDSVAVAVPDRLEAGVVLPGPDAAGGAGGDHCRAAHAPPERERAACHGRIDAGAGREHRRPARGEDFRRPAI